MTDLPTWANLLIVYLIATTIFHFIYLMDRRTKREGVLFTQPASPKSRVYAFLAGVALGGSFIIFWVLGFRESKEIAILAIGSIGLIAYSVGLDRPLTQIQRTYAEVFHGEELARYKKIIGIEGMTIDELNMQVQAGGRFVMFEYCISPLVITLDYSSDIYFIKAGGNTSRKGIRYSLISLLFGWISIFGPIHTIRCLLVNFRGGRDFTEQVVNWLNWWHNHSVQDNSSVSPKAP
jgi:hypothetical protein